MAGPVPAPPGPPRPRRPRGWLNYGEYLTVLWRQLRELDDEGIVLGGGLSVSDLTGARGRLARVRVEGRIGCAFGASVYAGARPATGEETGRTPVSPEALPDLDRLIRYAVGLARGAG